MDYTNGASAAAARGEAAEHLVAADLLEQGFYVSWPSSWAPYDLIAERLSDNRLFRIQVKRAYFGVHTRGRAEVWMANVRGGGGHTHRSYSADAFEILAVVVGDEILYIPWHGQYQGQKLITDDMLAEYGRFPCESSD